MTALGMTFGTPEFMNFGIGCPCVFRKDFHDEKCLGMIQHVRRRQNFAQSELHSQLTIV